MQIECIACEDDRQQALAEIERLREADSDSAEGEYRDFLLGLVAEYEAKGRPGHKPPPADPDPVPPTRRLHSRRR